MRGNAGAPACNTHAAERTPTYKARQPNVVFATDAQTTGSPDGKGGYETPSIGAGEQAASTWTKENDPEKLCAAFRDAMAAGKVADVSAIRRRILELGPAAVPDVAALLNAGAGSRQIEVFRLLVQLGGEKALAAALGKVVTVSEEDPNYGGYLAALADCRSGQVAVWLSDYLGRLETEAMRQRVLTILASLHGPEVVTSLAAQMAKPADRIHAEDCAETLATCSDPSQISALRELLEKGDSPDLQALAARGLASIGNDEACSILIEKASSSSPGVSVYCGALANVTSSYGQERLIAVVIDPALPAETRAAAARALAQQNSPRAQTVLANAAQGVSDTALLAEIANALTTSGNGENPPLLESGTGEGW